MFLSKKERASKSLRRLTKTKISTPVAQVNTLDLPKKIIKALYDYQAKGSHEISFKKGDFFHVTGRENDPEWFEACNPASNLKGLVPVSYFQVIDKTERSLFANRPTSSSTTSSNTLTSELDSGFSDLSIHGQNGTSMSNNKKKHQIYGVVMYDFKAERPDELEAQAGEAIVVIAQSNHEWLVAKPIGRLGGPGLIPVSFVQIRDAVTGELIMDNDHQGQQHISNHLLGVEDWKKQAQNYETSSIPLGIFESSSPSNSRSRVSATSSVSTTYEIVTFASVDSYILEGDQYWFVVYARVNENCHRILYRLYEDFYDFQLSLLQAYPIEAGKADRERILPYMPGPLTYVDETITSERRIDLDRYCKELLNLPKYLSESELVQRQLFGIHEGDIELDYDPRVVNKETITTSEQTVQQQIKIKIIYKDDIFAMKVPANCSLDHLTSKVQERIGEKVKMEYKNEATDKNEPLENEIDMEEAFVQAIQKGKLTVTAVLSSD
ncbi:uncharacterized protein BX663DRAFT_557183 [Cokeromyces recurvatus]|uniref:uncharacterized protein n=1 Tax=Cokeromyces recurvatus TaxID=90255 RepID=UPI0022209414|nr:uncharacterized protein BX663DRAFT_557183 [Cokeromyces recurvatus]KAI7907981.1 hypothetical protein BX663DRAFT_557183 [Cokeromyces recurvatus]